MKLLWIISGFLVAFLLLLLLPPTRQFFYKQFTQIVLYKNTVPLIDYKNVDLENDVLLDTRDSVEYAISHLPNAQFVGYQGFTPKIVKDIPKDQKIVVYCSVGYRSERIGEQLQELGYTNVHNLDGGIFTWINKEQVIRNKTKKKTKKVHPFSKFWGFWLTKGQKVYKP